MSTCTQCNDTGVIETGNNDLPCDCEAGASAVFNIGLDAPVTGAQVRRHFLNNSPEPIRLHGTRICTQCFGTKELDDLGFPASSGARGIQLPYHIVICPRCRGTGEEPRDALYSCKVEREAESAIDKLEAIAR